MFLKKPLKDCSNDEVAAIIATNLTGVINNVRALHKLLCLQRPLAPNPGQPYHFTMVSSTSAWRARDNETIYGALCAARSQFTRNFARELIRDLPGSKCTLVHPGGMDNPNFWAGTGQDTTKFMKADAVAKLIWNRVERQKTPFQEFSLIRDAEGNPVEQDGSSAPEAPF
jgi:NAD(P)-dependent dehydrogenase (short-subunit alcohol dehydrogenase family)